MYYNGSIRRLGCNSWLFGIGGLVIRRVDGTVNRYIDVLASTDLYFIVLKN